MEDLDLFHYPILVDKITPCTIENLINSELIESYDYTDP